ncbi:MAG: isoprenylcysteine carboxylmethyltransferase family protein [Firmicutes bacterium]|nr:isoprenylcysteine carboxylmethyltransferase family protein [Bacillota bacterium]
MSFRRVDSAGVIMPPPLIYGGGIVLGAVLEWAVPLRVQVLQYLFFRGLGLILLLGSVVVSLWALRVLSALGTSADPNQPTLVVADSGPFAFSRNPLYLSLTWLQLGLGLVLAWPWLWITLVAVMWLMTHGVIDREEQYLENKFGVQYLNYKVRVRRWI